MSFKIDTLRNQDLVRLLSNRKLRLVLDIDHTLVHASGISHLNQQERDHLLYDDGCRPHQHHYFGEGNLYNIRNLMIKLRPYIRTFLKEASEMFELSIYTMGDRRYARTLTAVLDPEGSYFGVGGKNVLTREDCTTPGQKGLDVLLSHERVTLVVDDTYTVWQLHPRSLILIAPYRFFADSSHPNRLSWSEFHKDESEVHGEFARILKVLRKVHSMFYDTREGDILWKKDVRVVLEEIRKESPKLFKLTSVPGACEPESDQHGCESWISMLSNLSLSSDSSEVTNQHQPILLGF